MSFWFIYDTADVFIYLINTFNFSHSLHQIASLVFVGRFMCTLTIVSKYHYWKIITTILNKLQGQKYENIQIVMSYKWIKWLPMLLKKYQSSRVLFLYKNKKKIAFIWNTVCKYTLLKFNYLITCVVSHIRITSMRWVKLILNVFNLFNNTHRCVH